MLWKLLAAEGEKQEIHLQTCRVLEGSEPESIYPFVKTPSKPLIFSLSTQYRLASESHKLKNFFFKILFFI